MLISMMLAMADFAPRALPEAKKAEILKMLEVEMVDARSARFIWPEQRDEVLYCGFVNAKNRLGAYTGYKPFSVVVSGKAGGFTLLDGSEGDVVTDLFAGKCRAAGYALTPSESAAP